MKNLGLRERKAAQTRLALLDALVARLAKRPFEEIGVQELATAAGISNASFFNYFPTKTDLIVYFVQLWSLEAAWHAKQAADPRSAIEAVFTMTARQLQRSPRVMAEVTVFQARLKKKPKLRPVTAAERALRFPELAGIEDLEATGFEAVIEPQLVRARKARLLPREANLQLALLAFASVFFGVPLLLGATAPQHIERVYLAQLDLTWRGLGASPRRKAP